MTAGRPRQATPESLYVFAHQLYWDFRRLAAGGFRHRVDEKRYQRSIEEIGSVDLDLSTRDCYIRIAVEDATKQLRVRGTPDVLEELLNAKTPESVLKICKNSHNWLRSRLGILPYHLKEHAGEFIAAKKHPRFPLSRRPSTRLKQVWFLSRALAGAIFGVEVRTAINLVGSKRPEQIFEESRAAKSARRQTKQRSKR
jgi:hypothetical protein